MPTLQQVTAAFTGACILANSEAELGDAVARLLTTAGLEFEREVELRPRDKIDFLCGRVGIELKIKSSATMVLRQLARYMESGRVDSLLLVTTRRQQLSALPSTLGGKTLLGVCVSAY